MAKDKYARPHPRAVQRALPVLGFLALLALPGCLEDLLGGCPPTSYAQWKEPGLYRALEGRPVGVQRLAPAPGIPWQPPSDAPAWNGFALHRVRWTPDGQERLQLTSAFVTSAGWEMDRALFVETARPLNHSLEELRVEFHALLNNVTLLSSDQQNATWESLLESMQGLLERPPGGPVDTVGYSYRVQIATPTRMDSLVAAAIHASESNVTDSSSGFRILTRNHWSFHFDVPTLVLTVDSPEGTFAPTVGANDRVDARVPDRYAGNESASREWLARSFDRSSLPAPAFEDWEFATAVC